MPTVPRYGDAQVRDQAIQPGRVNTQAPIEAFGGGAGVDRQFATGRAMIDDAQKIVVEEKQKADDAVIQSKYAKAVEEKNRQVYDPKEGVVARRGRDGLGVVDEFKPKYKKFLDDLESDLTPDQKAMFRKMRVREELEFDGLLNRHMSQESDRLQDDSFKSLITTMQDDTVQNFDVEGKVAGNLGIMKGAAAERARVLGMDAPQTQAFIADIESKTHVGVLSRMLANGDDLRAKGYFDANKAGLRGQDLTSVERALEEGSLRGESQRQADAIMFKAPDRVSAMAHVTNIKDPKLRDEVERRVNHHFAQLKQIEADQKEQSMLNATNIIEKTKDFDKVPPQVVAGLTVSERNGLRNYADSLREGKKPATEWATYYELKTLASTAATRDSFLRKNLMVYRPNMADAEFKELVTLQTALRSGDEKADKDLDGYRTTAGIVNDALASAGIDATSPKPGKEDAEKTALFRRAVDEQIVVHQSQTGKKATNEDVQRIVDNLLVKGTVPGSGWFGFFQKQKRAFEVKPGEAIAIEPKDIPRTERSKIEAALRARGIAVTDDKVLELYNRKLKTMVP